MSSSPSSAACTRARVGYLGSMGHGCGDCFAHRSYKDWRPACSGWRRHRADSQPDAECQETKTRPKRCCVLRTWLNPGSIPLGVTRARAERCRYRFGCTLPAQHCTIRRSLKSGDRRRHGSSSPKPCTVRVRRLAMGVALDSRGRHEESIDAQLFELQGHAVRTHGCRLYGQRGSVRFRYDFVHRPEARFKWL